MKRTNRLLSTGIILLILSAFTFIPSDTNIVPEACAAAMCGTTCTIQGCDGGSTECHTITCSDGTVVKCGKGGDGTGGLVPMPGY